MELNKILKENEIYLFYDIYKGAYVLVELYFKEIEYYKTLGNLTENLNFKLSNITKENITFDKNNYSQLITKINNISYLPTNELIVYNNSRKILNSNFAQNFVKHLSFNEDLKQYKGKFPTILNIMYNLAENDKKSLNWLLDWVSYIVRYNLGLEKNKLITSILFYGLQGSGKNLFINGILELFIKTRELSQKDLENQFNGYLVKSNLITFNEIQVSKKYNTMDEIKNTITCQNHEINIKGIPQFSIPNIHNYIFTSNKTIPLLIEEDDRRFTIFKPKHHLKEIISQEDLEIFDSCLKNPNKNNKYYNELLNFGNYLVNNKKYSSNIKACFENETKKKLFKKGLSLNETFINELKNKDFFEFCEENDLNYKKYFKGFTKNGYFTQKKLIFKLYDDYFKIMSKKDEFIKRKDVILDELEENNIFWAIGNESKRIKLIDEEASNSFKYLYQYKVNNKIYTDELSRIEEIEEVNLK